MLRTFNGVVACEPYKTHSTEIQIKNGWAKAQTKESLMSLKVVFDYHKDDLMLCKGDSIVVKAETSLLPFAKVEYELEGVKFVLIPVNHIFLIEQGGVSKW